MDEAQTTAHPMDSQQPEQPQDGGVVTGASPLRHQNSSTITPDDGFSIFRDDPPSASQFPTLPSLHLLQGTYSGGGTAGEGAIVRPTPIGTEADGVLPSLGTDGEARAALFPATTQQGGEQSLTGQMNRCRIEEGTGSLPRGGDKTFKNERSSAKEKAAKFLYVSDATNHKERADKHARSLMWACIFKIGRTYDAQAKWKIKEKMGKMIFSEAVAGTAPLEFIFASICPTGFAEDRYGKGRGRALCVVLRWTLSAKLWQIRQEVRPKEVAELGVWKAFNWLGAYTDQYSTYSKLIHKHFDDAEHIERYEVPKMEFKKTDECPEGRLYPVYELRKTKAHPEGELVAAKEVKIRSKSISVGLATYEGVEEKQRQAIAYIKHKWLRGNHNMRVKAWDHLEENLTFLVRKILLLRENRGGDREDDKEKNYFFAFGVDEKEPTTAELLQIPEVELPTGPPGVTDRNANALDALASKWGRFNLTLNYIGTVIPPKVRSTLTRKRSAPTPSSSSRTTARRRLSRSRTSARASRASVESMSERDDNGRQLGGDWLNDPKFLKLAEEHRGLTLHQIMTEKASVKTGRQALSKNVSLHHLAVRILLDFTRVENVDDLLAIHPFMLRAIHCCALGLSGILRAALGVAPDEILEPEECARGNIFHIVPEGAEDGIALFAGDGKTIPDFTPAQMEEYFEVDHTDYVVARIKEKLKAGTLGNTAAAVPVTESAAGNFDWDQQDPNLM